MDIDETYSYIYSYKPDWGWKVDISNPWSLLNGFETQDENLYNMRLWESLVHNCCSSCLALIILRHLKDLSSKPLSLCCQILSESKEFLTEPTPIPKIEFVNCLLKLVFSREAPATSNDTLVVSNLFRLASRVVKVSSEGFSNWL